MCVYLPGERRWGPMTLYFGCRNRDQDYLHGDEIEQALTDGVLDAVYLALSRQPGKPKTYVQNLLSENGAKIADDILLHKGHIYICGEAAMASGVCQTIENILVEHKNMSAKSAARFVLSSRVSATIYYIFRNIRPIDVKWRNLCLKLEHN